MEINQILQRQFGILSIYQNNSKRQVPRVCESISHGLVARFTMPGMNSDLWKRPQTNRLALRYFQVSFHCHTSEYILSDKSVL